MKKETIKIGWAEADITPVKRIDLCGQYYPRLSRNIHSRLGLTVLALESESGEQAVLVSLDNVGISPGIMEMARHRVKAAIPGIRPEKILVNATHVHTAPALYPVVGWYEPDREVITPEEYREFLCSRLVGAVARAWSGRAPGAVAAGRGYAVTGHCRRALFEGGVAEMYGDAGRDDFLGLEGNEDSTLELLFTYDGRKRPTGVILNAACPSQVMEATYSVSSDFMGEARRLLKKHFGAGFRTLCQVSAAGDQSPRDLVRNRTADFWGEKGVAVLGKRLSDAVIEAQAGIGRDEITGRLEFCHQVASLPLPMRFPAPAELAAARKELKRLTALQGEKEAFKDFYAEVRRNEKRSGRPGPYDSKLHHFVLLKNAQAVVARAAARRKGSRLSMELHVIRIGPAAFCTNVFELFLDYGLRIKARSRAAQTFVVQLCGGMDGYLPTRQAEKYGGYGALINNSIIGSRGGGVLVEATLKRINALFPAGSK